MRKKPHSFLKIILLLFNVGIIISYLSVCLVPFINTGENWYFAIPGVIFPLLFFSLLFLIILRAILRSKKWFWISLVVLCLGIQQVLAVFSFHLPKEFSLDKQPRTLRILQWNVMGWDENNEAENGDESYRPQMMDLVRNQNADVLCFEEFFEPKDTVRFKPNITAISKMGYPYHFFVPTKSYENDDATSGTIIFSKYPIIDSAVFNFNRKGIGEHLLYIDIKAENKIFRVFATHLKAINFAEWDNQRSNQSGTEDESSNDYKTIISKLIRGYIFRYPQAELIQQKIAESPYPAIICGDFNDIPNSSTYFKIKGNLQDPFLKKGYWTGRTTRKNFGIITPTLRIDYILADRKFSVNQFQIIHVPYSDHFPVETDLEY